MKRPIQNPRPLTSPLWFHRLTPAGYSVKDSCSFLWDGEEYIACSYIGVGGIAVFKKVNGDYQFFENLFPGWGRMWAPCAVIDDGKLYIFCNDTYGQDPFWLTQRICYFEYVPGQTPANPAQIAFDTVKGRIDPEICRIGNEYYLFYVIMDWNLTSQSWEWWDIYYSKADNPFGPYYGEWNISQMQETGIEEAPCFIGDKLYWSVMSSDTDSHIRRGDLVYTAGQLNVSEDISVRISAVNSVTCTHPDVYNSKLRATLKSGDEFFIGEVI